jgi:REP element-mobilizing transposase RayT
MPTPRRTIVDARQAGFYHCCSRCVRRAFLCGDEFDHRRDWIRDRLRELAGIFAIDVCGYAVLSNHLHVVLWTEPARAGAWSRREVARRWLRLFPGALAGDDSPGAFERAVRRLAEDEARISVLRGRLSDLSWFMRCLCEPVARRANLEDDCTGRFWEGRFKSHRLLDEAAVLACLVYVDLNVIRAKMARTPEESDHTSVKDRIAVRQFARRRPRSGQSQASRTGAMEPLLPHLPEGQAPKHDEDGIWLAPIEKRSAKRGRGERRRRGMLRITLEQYLGLGDRVGRIVRSARHGAIPAELRSILERLDLDVDRWLECMRDAGRMIGTAIGSAASLAREAARRGGRWVVGAMPIYRDSPAR